MNHPGDEKLDELSEDLKSEELAEDISEEVSEEKADSQEVDDDDGFELQSVGDDEVPAEEAEDAEDQVIDEPKPHRPIDDMRLEAKVEAMIFASQKPMKITEIHQILEDETVTLEDVQEVLDALTDFYEDRCGGFKLQYIKRQGYQFWSAAEAGPIMEHMFASRPRPISRAALETLAIVAYRQPVTRAEVEFIRGVDVGSIFKGLVERELVKCVGRKEVVGRPMLFGTTDEFLKIFQLQSLKDLPPLEAFQAAPDMMQSAVERLEEGSDEIDVEQYISDNIDNEDLAPIEVIEEKIVDNTESVDDVEASTEETVEEVVEEDTNEIMPDTSDEPVRLQGATAIDETLQQAEYNDDYDAPTEMDIPIGDSLEKGSGELDN